MAGVASVKDSVKDLEATGFEISYLNVTSEHTNVIIG